MKYSKPTGWDAPLGKIDIKLVFALMFAIAGLAWAAVSFMPRDATSQDGPRVIASALDEEGNQVEPEYTKASSNRQREQVQVDLVSLVDSGAAVALSDMDIPSGASVGVSDAVINAFLPILSGDHDSFVDAIVAMGGKIAGDLEGDHPIFKHLTKIFAGAKVDLSRITVKRYEQQQGRRMGMRRNVMTDDVDTEPGAPSEPAMRSQVMEMQPASLFPDAPGKSDPSAIEVQIPVQPKGEKLESIFSLVLTWNPEVKLWQPVAYRTIQNRLVEED